MLLFRLLCLFLYTVWRWNSYDKYICSSVIYFANILAVLFFLIRYLMFPNTILGGDIPFCGSLEHRWMPLINATAVIQLIWEVSKQLNKTYSTQEPSQHKYPPNVSSFTSHFCYVQICCSMTLIIVIIKLEYHDTIHTSQWPNMF